MSSAARLAVLQIATILERVHPKPLASLSLRRSTGLQAREHFSLLARRQPQTPGRRPPGGTTQDAAKELLEQSISG
jgi:hypothetical protein